jgi:hypothetical protein
MIGGYRLHTNVQARAVPPALSCPVYEQRLRFLPAAAIFERNGA